MSCSMKVLEVLSCVVLLCSQSERLELDQSDTWVASASIACCRGPLWGAQVAPSGRPC